MNAQFQYSQPHFTGRGGRGGFHGHSISSNDRGGSSRGRNRGSNMGRINVNGTAVVGRGTGFNMGYAGSYIDDSNMGGTESYFDAYNSQAIGGIGTNGNMVGDLTGNLQSGPMRRPYQKRNFNQAAFSPY